MQLLPDPPPSQDVRPPRTFVRESRGSARSISRSRGHSSAGRASGLQPEGHRFDPGWLHQPPQVSEVAAACQTFAPAHEMSRIAESSPERALPPRQRLLFKNPEVFVDDAEFSSEQDFMFVLWKCRVRTNVMNQLHIPKLLGVIWSSE